MSDAPVVARAPVVNPACLGALRDAAKAATLEELAERGVNRLRTIGTRDIAFLIERALNRTLVERTLGKLQPEEMVDLSADVEAEFKRQLDGLQDIRDSRALLDRHRKDMADQVSAIRQRLAERESFEDYVRQTGGLQDPDAVRHFRLQILGCLKPLLSRSGSDVEQGKRVTDDLFELFQAELGRLVAEKGRKVETEKVLARVSKMKDLESGVESIYRTVQGLSDDEADSDRKKMLMQAIFLANRRLHDELSRSA